MRVKKDVLSSFLKKVSMKDSVHEAVFDFTDSGVMVNAMSSDNTTMVNAKLSPSAFSEYQAHGKVGFQYIATMIKSIDSFDKEVDMKIENGLVKFEDSNKSIAIPALEPDFVQTRTKDISTLEFEQSVKISSESLHDFMKNVTSLNKDYDIQFRTADGMLELSNTIGNIKVRRVIKELDCQQGTTARFGPQLFNAVSSMTNELHVSLKNDYPVKVSEVTDTSSVDIAVAPRLENEHVIEVESEDDDSSSEKQTEESQQVNE